jgi:hypothetical protein
MLDFRPYFRRPLSTLASIATDPLEAWLRLREQYAAYQEGSPPPDLYRPHPDWENRLHRRLCVSLADAINAEFWTLWTEVVNELDAKGIRAGPSSFKGWNDGDPGFVRAIWCLVRCLQPSSVIETGVAHGVTSRFILEAFQKNGKGRLWSIDRPPIEREWREQIGAAVNPQLRDRWSYVTGSSRRRLPGLLSEVGEIDLFIHDSLHSERNVRFELDRAWACLRPGGAAVVDDIDVNRGFWSFSRSFSVPDAFVCEAEPVRPDPRRFNKKGLFGIILKPLRVENGIPVSNSNSS